MSLGNTEKEIQCVINWFEGWSMIQKQDFLKELIDHAVPCSVDTLFDSMHALNVKDKPPSIFQCQIKLFTQWFEGWTDKERNDFVFRLSCIDSKFVEHFNEQVSQSAQQNLGQIFNGNS